MRIFVLFLVVLFTFSAMADPSAVTPPKKKKPFKRKIIRNDASYKATEMEIDEIRHPKPTVEYPETYIGINNPVPVPAKEK